MWFVLVLLCSVHADINYFNFLESVYRRNEPTEEPFYNYTWFNALENYQFNAVQVTEDKYPWIARVVHSTSLFRPYICTAVCVEEKIFLTAAECVFSLKVPYTSVIYRDTHFSVKAFVIPSNNSKQFFDDLGFIVVNDEGFQGQWATVQLFDTCNRTDNDFNWFVDIIPNDNWDHIVVGYATEKHLKFKYLLEDDQYKLMELKVITSLNICPGILIYNDRVEGFHVPCYHSCSAEQFRNKDAMCSNYLGVAGGAVFNIKTNKLLGIATWGPNTNKYELPVGFSVPNSDNFFEDYTCARRIKSDRESDVKAQNYQGLCNFQLRL